MTASRPSLGLRGVRRTRCGRARALRACGTLALLVIAVGLADCGKKGPPVAPPGVPDVYPRTYPRE